jgi:hypothetical protein
MGRVTIDVKESPFHSDSEAVVMDIRDIDLRNKTYQRFVELGRAPTIDEVAKASGWTAADVLASWQRLHDQHALVLNPSTSELRMANPFSAVQTAYRVLAAGRWWYANCAWDALGVCAALHTDGHIDTSCPDCLEPLAIKVKNEQPDRKDLLFHCLLSAAHWWDDIVFT